MIDAGTFGAINWVDLSTPDVAAAAEFYGALLGWTYSKSTTPLGEYFVCKVGEREVAGMMEQDPAAADSPPVWTAFCYVADIEETVARVEAAGGLVLEPPFDIPDGPRICVIADSTGAMFALIAGGEHPVGEYFFTSPGAVCWVELLTPDPAAARAFYGPVFGWTATEDRSDGYTMYRLGGENVAGMKLLPSRRDATIPPHWAAYFAVADCAAAADMAVQLGGKVVQPATEIVEGRFAALADPHGARFSVMEYRY